jgi:hypothetical protein
MTINILSIPAMSDEPKHVFSEAGEQYHGKKCSLNKKLLRR